MRLELEVKKTLHFSGDAISQQESTYCCNPKESKGRLPFFAIFPHCLALMDVVAIFRTAEQHVSVVRHVALKVFARMTAVSISPWAPHRELAHPVCPALSMNAIGGTGALTLFVLR